MKHRANVLLWIGGAGLVLAAVGAVLWGRWFHGHAPVEVARDLRPVVLSARAPTPMERFLVERFLESRYGPLTEAANRQRALLDFFNIGNIEELRVLTSRMDGPQLQAGIAAMAQWVADYRRTMSPEEKQTLGSYLGSETGRRTLQQATAQYLRQDVYLRAATAPVIKELMATLAALPRP